MQLVITKDTGRFRKGEVYDYPRPTWNHIAKSAKRKLGTFTKPLEEALNHAQSK